MPTPGERQERGAARPVGDPGTRPDIHTSLLLKTRTERDVNIGNWNGNKTWGIRVLVTLEQDNMGAAWHGWEDTGELHNNTAKLNTFRK